MHQVNRLTARHSRLLALLALVGALLIPATSALAAGTLTAVSWSVSNTQTAGASITYAWAFTTATAGKPSSITMTVPTGTTAPGGITVTHNYGVGAGTAALAGTTVTYTVTTPVYLGAAIPIYLELKGFTNTTTAGSYSSSVETLASGSALDGPTTSNTNNFSSGGVATTIAVAKSSVFSIDVNSFDLALDPTVNPSATQDINIGVSSNAKSGYTLTCKVDQQPTSAAGYTLAAYTTGMASAAAWTSGGASDFGYALSETNNGGGGKPTDGGTLSASNYAGFTTAGETCGADNSGLSAGASYGTGNPLGTNVSGCGVGLCASAAHWWLATVKAVADYTTAADAYTDNITFTLTPSY